MLQTEGRMPTHHVGAGLETLETAPRGELGGSGSALGQGAAVGRMLLRAHARGRPFDATALAPLRALVDVAEAFRQRTRLAQAYDRHR